MKLASCAAVILATIALAASQQHERLLGTDLGAPPKPGEIVVQNGVLDTLGARLEVLGVCKISDGELSCWSPSGKKDPSTTAEIRKLLGEKDGKYRQSLSAKFGKKNRLLVLKKHVTDAVAGNSSYYEFPRDSGSGAIEGWDQVGFTAYPIGINETKVPRTEFQFAAGWFEKARTSFPLRFHALTPRTIQRSIPLSIGEFSEGGNRYKILSISDRPSRNSTKSYSENGYGNENLKKVTYVTVMPLRTSDPNLATVLMAAGKDGRPFAATNRHDEPIYESQMKAFEIEQQKRRSELDRLRNGAGDNDLWAVFNRRLTGIGLDPKVFGLNEAVGFRLRIDLSKVKSLSVSTQRRAVYVFDNIRLDPN